MRCLLTGATGLLGNNLLFHIPKDWELFVTVNRNPPQNRFPAIIKPIKLDLKNWGQVNLAVQSIHPDVVIHTASIGDIDYCQRNRNMAWELNVAATRYLLEACAPFDSIFVFVSTIYVYDGNTPPYDENSIPNPLNYYAETKLQAEVLVQRLCKKPIILRPSTLYGWHLPEQRANCLTWLLHRLLNGENSKIVNDVLNNLMWVGDTSKALISAVEKKATGLFVLGGPSATNRYEFSTKAARVFGFSPRMISPVGSNYFPGLTPRPKDTTCIIKKQREVLGVSPLTPNHALHLLRKDIEGMNVNFKFHFEYRKTQLASAYIDGINV